MGADRSEIRVGELTILPRERRVGVADVDVPLTAREFDILSSLASHPGWVFSAEELSPESPAAYASPFAVQVHVTHLRQKLVAAGARRDLIETVRGAGYRLGVETLPDGRPRRACLASTPFVGREREIVQLQTLLPTSLDEGGAFALIVGEPGIGKTSLVEAWIESSAEVRSSVLRGVCDCCASGEHWVWQQIVQCLDDLVGTSSANPAGTATVNRLVGKSAPGDGSLSGPDRLLAYEAMRRYLTDTAKSLGRPHVIWIDDLNCAARSSLRLLAYLLKRLRESPVFVVAACRQPHLQDPVELRSVVEEAGHRAASLRLDLRGLTQEEVKLVVDRELDVDGSAGQIASALVDLTGGNPLFVRECLRVLGENGRDDLQTDWDQVAASSVGTLVVAHVATLPEETQRLLRIASLIGSEFDPSIACSAAGDLLVSSLDAALEAGVIMASDRPGRLRFANPIFQESLAVEIPQSESQQMHRDIAAAIWLLDCKPDRRVYALAHHHTLAGPDSWRAAVGFHAAAARLSWARYAFEDAVGHLEAALGMLDASGVQEMHSERIRAALLERRGGALSALGDAVAARESYRAALATRLGADPLVRSRMLTKIAFTALFDRRREIAEECFAKAFRVLESAPRRDPLWWREWVFLRLHEAVMAEILGEHVDPEILRGDLQAAVEAYATPAQRSRYHNRLAAALAARDRWHPSEEAIAEQQSAVHYAAGLSSPHRHGWMLTYLGSMLAYRGDISEAEARLEEAHRLMRECGDARGTMLSLHYLALCARRRCDVDATSRRTADLCDLLDQGIPMPECAACAEGNLAWIALRRGHTRQASTRSAQGVRILTQGPATLHATWVVAWPSLSCALRVGNEREAARMASLMAGSQALEAEMDCRLGEASSLLACGDSEAGMALLRDLEPEARVYGYA